LTASVKKQLEEEGHKVVVLNLPNTSGNFENVVILNGNTDQDIKEAVETIISKYGQIGSFIHLHPHFEFKGHNFASHFPAERNILKTVFLLAKYLQPSLQEASKKQRPAFMTVTRLDGKLGLGKRSNTSIMGGGLSGLVKSLNLEWSPVFCRAIDIQPELNNEVAAKHVFEEMHDANLLYTEIGISEEGRKTFETTETKLGEKETITADINSEDVFLVSGGAKGVTATCVIELAKKFQPKLVLIGRSSLDFEVPAYAANEDDEATLKRLIMTDLKEKGEKVDLKMVKRTFNNIIAKKEIDNTLAQIKAAGSEVVYLKSDITNLSVTRPELNEIVKNWGAITGLIHGAGRLADKHIQNKTEDDFNNVLSVKLDGLLSMLSVVNPDQLKHLVLFSSVAGFYGNIGQTDYAMANEVLSKAAHLFRTNHPDTKVSAINWGAWEGGMVSPELQKKFEEAGVTLVNHPGGAAMFVNEFNTIYSDQPQVIIGGTLPTPQSELTEKLKTYKINRHLELKDNPFLKHHSIQGNAVLPVVNAAAWMADSCVKLFPDFRLSRMKNLQLFKGIVFDGSEKKDYYTEIKEVYKTPEIIAFEVAVMSEGAKLPTYHYKSEITLRHKSVKETPEKFFHDEIKAGTAINGAELYKDGSLFHGPYYQGIEEILEYSDNHMVMKCRANSVPLAEQGQFPITSLNTFFLDIQYQGMVVWVQKHHDGAKSLPLKTDEGIVYKDLPFDKELFVHISVEENTAFKMSAKCTVYDQNGEVYLITSGAAVTVSPELKW
jgi:NAD(P)-dependent dehydrogenase (short-subunit alcohol dehydrogenase family)